MTIYRENPKTVERNILQYHPQKSRMDWAGIEPGLPE
jgi:hypothetical protein